MENANGSTKLIAVIHSGIAISFSKATSDWKKIYLHSVDLLILLKLEFGALNKTTIINLRMENIFVFNLG